MATIYGNTINSAWKSFITYTTSISNNTMTISVSKAGIYAVKELTNYDSSKDSFTITITDTVSNTVLYTNTWNTNITKGTIKKDKTRNYLTSKTYSVNKTNSTRTIKITWSIFRNSNGSYYGTSTATSNLISLDPIVQRTVTYNQGTSSTTAPSGVTYNQSGSWTCSSVQMQRNSYISSTYNIEYTFLGWSTSSSASQATYFRGVSYNDPGFNLVLYPVFSSTYTYKYNSYLYFDDDGKNASNMPQTNPQHDIKYNTTNAHVHTIPNNTPTTAGFVFGGWSDGTNTYQPGENYTVPGGEHTTILTAIWIESIGILNYNANGGNLNNVPSSVSLTYTNSYSITNDIPSRLGYTFNGWQNFNKTHTWLNGNLYKNSSSFLNIENEQVIPNGATLYATWIDQSAIITYNANQGTLGNIPETDTLLYSQEYYIPTKTPFKAGYEFLGWSTTQGSLIPEYYEGQLYKAANTSGVNVILYAVWQDPNSTTSYINYDANGGNLNNIISPQQINYTNAANISSISPTRTGYRFLGWSIKKNSTTVSYSPGDFYKDANTAPQKLNLYAIWEIDTNIYVGVNNKAKKIKNIYIGNENDIARPIIGLWVGDSNNKAKKLF